MMGRRIWKTRFAAQAGLLALVGVLSANAHATGLILSVTVTNGGFGTAEVTATGGGAPTCTTSPENVTVTQLRYTDGEDKTGVLLTPTSSSAQLICSGTTPQFLQVDSSTNLSFTGSLTITLDRTSNNLVTPTGTYKVRTAAEAPEPGTLTMLGLGLALGAWMLRRQARG